MVCKNNIDDSLSYIEIPEGKYCHIYTYSNEKGKCEICKSGYEPNSERTKCIQTGEEDDTVLPCSEYSGNYNCNSKSQCSYFYESYNYCAGNNFFASNASYIKHLNSAENREHAALLLLSQTFFNIRRDFCCIFIKMF